jgi:hypothetical protein
MESIQRTIDEENRKHLEMIKRYYHLRSDDDAQRLALRKLATWCKEKQLLATRSNVSLSERWY